MTESNHEPRDVPLDPLPDPGESSPRLPPPLPDQKTISPGSDKSVGRTQLPPPPPTDEEGDDLPSADDRQVEFLARARFVIAEQRGFTPKCEAMLESVAAELHLPPEQARESLETLRRPPPRPEDAELADSGCAAVDAEPPAPPKQADSPQATFRAYAFEALSASSRDVIRESKEQRIIEEGVSKLGLSPVLARQLLLQVAQDAGKDLASHQRESSASEESDSAESNLVGQFTLRAKAILAEQRGINSRSRVLLAAAAREIGLTEEQADEAVASLQGSSRGVSGVEAWRQERLDSFRAYLVQEVAKMKQKVVTSRLRQKWLSDAEQRHGVDETDGTKVIRDVLAEHEVRSVSEEQAKDFIRSVVADLLGDAVVLDDDVRVRVFSEGSQWGLSPIQVDAIVRERIRANRKESSALSSFVRYCLVGGIGVVLSLMAAVAWVLLSDDQERIEPVPVAPVETQGPSSQPPSSPSAVPSGWWVEDESVLVAMTKFRRVIPEKKPLLDRICQQDTQARSLAYRELVAAAAASTDNVINDGLYQELIITCHAGDPSEECAGVLRESLLSLIPASDARLAAQEEAFDDSFWAMRTLLSAFLSPTSSPERIEMLARDASRKFGSSIDLSLDKNQLERQCGAAFYKHLFHVITANVVEDPLLAGALFGVLERQASRYLSAAEMDQARVDFLSAAIPLADEDWRRIEPLISTAIRSTDALIVLKMVELMEQARTESLRTYMAEKLQARAGLVPNARSVEEAASRVRESFGAKQVVTGSARWSELERRIEDRRSDRSAAIDDSQAMLQEAVDYAGLATMACALGQGEAGYATFDELAGRSRVVLAANPLSQPGGTGRRQQRQPAADMQRQNALRFIQYLADPRRRPAHRVVYLRSLASFAPGIDEIERDAGKKLADYLMKPKADDEHRIVMEHAPVLGRWRNVRLALADSVLESDLQQDRLQPMIEAVLGRKLILDDQQAWKERLYEALLESVMDDLSYAASRNVGDDRVFDQAQEALRDFYTLQARIMGLSQEATSSASSPAELLVALIDVVRPRLEAGDEGGRKLLDRLPHELEALRSLSDDDLQWTAAIQRVWIRCLAKLIAIERPTMSSQAEAILSRIERPETSPPNVIAQLCAGEKAELDLWLLLRNDS